MGIVRTLWVTLCGFVLALLAAAATFYWQPLWVNDEIIRLHLWRQHVHSRSIVVDSYRLHYFEASPPHGDGTPLLLIHGLGSRGEDWSPMIPSLAAAGFHVYAPDLLGYGRSPQPDVDYSISLQEQTVVDFARALHLDHADLAGWSMGGWVAMKLTLDHPAMVDRLVLYDAAGVYFPPTFDASLFVPRDPEALTRLMWMLTPQPKPLPAFAARAAVRRLQGNGWVIQRSVHAMENGKDLLDFRLPAITRPTLVVWGGLDRLIPLAAGEAIHRGIPGSSLLVIAGCGHLAPGECAPPVLRGTIDFLRADPPTPPHETTVNGSAASEGQSPSH